MNNLPTLTRGKNAVAVLRSMTMPVVTASTFVVDLAEMLNAVTVPDDDAGCAAWLAKIPPEPELRALVTVLDQAVAKPVLPEEAQALAVILLDGCGKQAGDNAATYASALASVTESDDIIEDGDDGTPISAVVIALAIKQLWKYGSKFLPAPCEFRQACLDVRERVIGLHMRLSDGVQLAIDLRAQLEWRLAPSDVSEGDDAWLRDTE